MANTSGAVSFNLDLAELVEEAFERAGGELRTGYDLRTARRSLNIMFADWAKSAGDISDLIFTPESIGGGFRV